MDDSTAARGSDPKAAAKQAVAEAGARLVESGTVVGLGSGSTAARFIEALGARVRNEGLDVRGVPTSEAAADLARGAGIPVIPLRPDTRPALAIDGADEVGPGFALIKGGGGALVREKLVAAAATTFVVMVDAGKIVATLGAFPLPVAILPFGVEVTLARLGERFGVAPALRRRPDGNPYQTDDGLFLADLPFGRIDDPAALEDRLKRERGVTEVGLFNGLAARVLVGHADGSVTDAR
jgi:ribose 5-phosphate isomerase A